MQKDTPPNSIKNADIEWRDGDTPASRQFSDIYYSSKDGLAEARYVFLQHNHLAERWQALAQAGSDKQPFVIAETGFGSGLNFLAAWQLWRQHAPAKARLHFISAEKYPLSASDLQRALASQLELADLAGELQANYPLALAGQHLVPLDGGRVTLHLLFGDASDVLQECLDSDHPAFSQHSGAKVDAWFLDGFTPSRNPDTWRESLFSTIARLSHSNTTLATFTAASQVRRQLQAEGFEIQKAPGFGSKRELIYGRYLVPEDNVEHSPTQKLTPKTEARTEPKIRQRPGRRQSPWYLTPTPPPGRQVAVIGGGVAGCSTAYSLALRGCQVTLIERQGQLATGASGNPRGMLYTKLSHRDGILNQFSLSSYLFALRHYQQLRKAEVLSDRDIGFCGMLQLVTSEKDQQLFSQLQQRFKDLPALVQFADAAQATKLAGITVDRPAVFLPATCWVSPPQVCRQLCGQVFSNGGAISQQLNSHALSLQRTASGQWQISTDEGFTTSADIVVIANSRDARHFEQSSQLPLKTIRGQITLLNSGPQSGKLRTVVCQEGYITPANENGIHAIGASFGLGDEGLDERQQDHSDNITMLSNALPVLNPELAPLSAEHQHGRVGLRCNSPDYLPIVGPLHDHQQFLQDYAPLRKKRRDGQNIPGRYHPGLYINVAHGSRGLTSTPLCSELLAAQILGEPRPLPRTLCQALQPARFLIRDLIRNKI